MRKHENEHKENQAYFYSRVKQLGISADKRVP